MILDGYEHMLVIGMPRPLIPRQVLHTLPAVTFTPGATPPASLGRAGLTLDGLEALRLADLEGLYQEEGARRMGVSRATFARVLAEAWPCPVHGEGRRRGRGCRCDADVEAPPRRRYRSGWESPPTR